MSVNRNPWTARAVQSVVLGVVLHACASIPDPHGDPVDDSRESPARTPDVCLALNLYHEARSEGRRGMRAVAAVTLNRVADPRFPETVCAVVGQGGERPLHRCQFSWWCDGEPDTPRNSRAWRISLEVARSALETPPRTPIGSAKWYHAVGVRPSWHRTLNRVVRIGDHVFYDDR